MAHSAISGVDRCQRYSDDVLSGRILAPNTIKLACERFERDKENPALHYNEDAANIAVAMIEKLVHAKGRWQRQRIHLEDHQCFEVCNLFGWKWRSTGLRRFRHAYVQKPRKNGKSLLAICIGLLMAFCDNEPGAEAYFGATTQDQAKKLLFNPAKFIAKNTPGFANRFGIEINASTLVRPDNFSNLQAVIKKPDDGSNPHFACCDEFHLHEDTSQWSVFDTGSGARQQPLLYVPTTAGHLLGGPCHIMHDECIKILQGEFEDDTQFALIWEPDEDDEWSDPDTFKKVNPNYGVIFDEAYLFSKLRPALRSADKQNDYRTKHLNQFVGAKTAWMNMVAWQRQKCDLTINDFIGEACHAAVDMSEQKDCTTAAFEFKRQGKYYVFCFHFVPEAAFEWNDKYKKFSLDQRIHNFTVTPGNAQDFDEIENCIKAVADKHTIRSISFDPWQSAQMMQRLQATGLTVYKATQQFSAYSDSMKNVETEVLDGNFFHPGDPVLTWMIGNTACLKNKDSHCKPVKALPNSPLCKIDGTQATLMAHRNYLEDGPTLDDWLADPVSI